MPGVSQILSVSYFKYLQLPKYNYFVALFLPIPTFWDDPQRLFTSRDLPTPERPMTKTDTLLSALFYLWWKLEYKFSPIYFIKFNKYYDIRGSNKL